jgi:hypothetical protein
MDAVTPQARFLEALDRGDREAVRLALHPHVRWTCADGTVVVGRRNVLDMLAAGNRPARPVSIDTRDDQIYRCTASGRAAACASRTP